ncbi:hypothetical protein Ndes2526B_g06212 [Nannochloris sp. 'desiccata']|nr:putative Uridine diphosphate glucose pyrophosphatase NUDT14 [Chlorella desiccata (nom. nud.)]
MACVSSFLPGVGNLITFTSKQIKSKGKTSRHSHCSAPASSKPLHSLSRVDILLPRQSDYEAPIEKIIPASEMSKLPALLTARIPVPSSVSTVSSTISPFLASISSGLPATLLLCIISAVALPLPAEAFSLQDAVSGLEAAIAAAGPLGPILFIGAYVIATVFLIPASVLTVAAGFLFGPISGSIVVSIAATLGATAAFLVGRYIARPAVARRAAEDTRFAAVDRAIAAQGAKIVLLLRLSPLVPFSLLNYALSLTSIPLGSYIGASWAGMLPGTIAYVALGGAGKAAAETAAGVVTSPLQLVLYGVGALATLGATVLIIHTRHNTFSSLFGNFKLHTHTTTATSITTRTTATALHDTNSVDLYPHGIEPLPQGVPAAEILSRLGGPEHILVEPLTKASLFVKPQSVFFKLDGKKRRWDMVSSHASVAILLYHTTRKAFILVRQFRPAVYATAVRTAAEEEQGAATTAFPSSLPLHHGFTFELCAGIVGDKPELSLFQVAQEEILEETGFDIDISNLNKITSFNSAVGISGSRQTIFAAEVDDSMLAMPKDGVGGGLADHGEAIEVVALPVAGAETFLMDESLGKSAGLMFVLTYAKSTGMFDL